MIHTKRKAGRGSRAFFSGIEGFKAHDCDELVLTTDPVGFEWRMERRLRDNCRFTYLLESPADMIQRTLNAGEPFLVGKFLVPEVAEAIGATVADILPLEPLLEKLDDKYRYIAVIFEAVKANGSFTLSDEQRAEAYAAYTAARVKKRPRRHIDLPAEPEQPAPEPSEQVSAIEADTETTIDG